MRGSFSMVVFFFLKKAKNSINVVRCSLNLIQKVSETKIKINKSNKKKQTLLKQQGGKTNG